MGSPGVRPGCSMLKRIILLWIILPLAVQLNGQADFLRFGSEGQVPAALKKNVLTALSFYPELKDTRIRFIVKKNLRNSVMQAQPVAPSLLRGRKKRRYRVNISPQFRLVHASIPITSLPDSVLVGWIGHELGHILDYERRNNTGMMAFGYRYYFYPGFVKRAEEAADTLAVARGLGRYLIATKRFILDHAELPPAYKEKIARLYLSPEAILELVEKLEGRNRRP